MMDEPWKESSESECSFKHVWICLNMFQCGLQKSHQQRDETANLCKDQLSIISYEFSSYMSYVFLCSTYISATCGSCLTFAQRSRWRSAGRSQRPKDTCTLEPKLHGDTSDMAKFQHLFDTLQIFATCFTFFWLIVLYVFLNSFQSDAEICWILSRSAGESAIVSIVCWGCSCW
jgi:hypothetical protein